MGVFANRRFRYLWSGQTISQLGSQITLVALPLLALKELNASVPAVGALTAVQFAPFLLLGLPAGAWVDRWPRRPVLIVCDLGRAAVLLALPLAFLVDMQSLALLYVVGFVHGVLTVFFDVAYQSLLPDLVEPPQLPEANGRLELSRAGAQISGPSIGGWLVSLLRAPVAVLADSLSYLISALLIWRIRVPAAPPRDADRGRRLRTEIMEGLRFVVGHRTLRPILICTAMLNLFLGGMMFSLIIAFAVKELGMSPARVGLVMGLGNLGLLAGALTAARIGRRLGVGRSIILGALLNAAGLLLVPLAAFGHPTALLITGLIVAWFGAVLYNVHQVSLRQTVTPQHLLGRMNATMRFAVWGTVPAGALLGGAAASLVGLPATMWIAAVGGTCSLAAIALSPVRQVVSFAPAASR